MTPGFIMPSPLFACPSLDGLNYLLAGPLFYVARDGRIICTPQGGTTDGPSIPSWCQSFVQKYGKGITAPAYQHDGGYQGYQLLWYPASRRFLPAPHNKKWNDDLFNESMDVCGMGGAERLIVFETVNLMGASSYSNDLALALPKIVVPKELPECLRN